MYEKLLICWIFVGIGAFLIGVAIPLILRKVKPNRWYGVRTEKTLSSEKVWYVANRLMGINLVVAGVATASIAGSMMLTDLSELTFGMVLAYAAGGFVISMGVAVMHGFFVVERLR